MSTGVVRQLSTDTWSYPMTDALPDEVDPTVQPPVAVPYLLVMPGGDGQPQPVAWPGTAEGQTTWAIPVTIPAGTPGFAVFVPLVPGAQAKPVDGMTAAPVEPAPVTPVVAKPVTPVVAKPVTPVVATAAAPVEELPDDELEEDEDEDEDEDDEAVAPPSGAPLPPPGSPFPRQPAAPSYRPYQTVPRVMGPPRPLAPGFLEARWPGPKPASGWRVPVAVLVGGLVAAIVLPGTRVGIGWFLGGFALVAAVIAGIWPAAAALPKADRAMRAVWAGSAVVLLSVLAFRNAWWLVTFCVLGALGCAALAIVGGQRVRSILFSLVAAPFAALRGIPWVAKHLSATGDRREPPRHTQRVVWSAIITVLFVLVFGALLSSADAAFSQVLSAIVPTVSVGRVFLFIMCALIAVAAVYTVAAPPDLSTIDKPGTARLRRLEWGLPIGALVLLYSGFVVVQATVLFGGQHHVLQTAGLSYAEYARSGFWQLATVTVLTIAVLGGVTRWASREDRVDRILLRTLLGLLSSLSIVIVVSALSRMYAYQKVYSFTGERIFVMAFELLLGTVFIMIMVAGIRWRGAWIPSTSVGLAVVMLLTLAVLNPEDYAARRNIARYKETGKIDAWYLRALSSDATPALSTLPDLVRRCTLSWIVADLDEPDPWYGWNLGRENARDALDRVGSSGIGGSSDCQRADQFDLPKTR
ncbi:hypothetical protein Dsi01nite_030180 [Dactylosporangium siamense]|uniref:DUF4173 domain-containing protein n=3 Tax=Dactylosporangium siamense TaxID=685454 RepID=A0A919PIW5_9ACTN|nr:hypothetical protein Dsi01nite_030180 [Dactylosporangium siamense]